MTTTADVLDLARPITPRPSPLYASRPVAIATRHDKAAVLADVLAVSGLLLVPVPVATDRLGTFTGEVPRALDLFTTATAKARMGSEVSGIALNLASEGAFDVERASSAAPVQREVVALLDVETGLVVHGRATRPAPWMRSFRCTPDTDLAALVGDLDLTAHRLTARPAVAVGLPDKELVTKGVADLDALRTAVIRAATAGGEVVVETDLRSHVCPMRHPVMQEAAADLVRRLATPCPDCQVPGFGPEEDATGGTATVHRCPACGYARRG